MVLNLIGAPMSYSAAVGVFLNSSCVSAPMASTACTMGDLTVWVTSHESVATTFRLGSGQ